MFEQPITVAATHVGMFFNCTLLHPTVMLRRDVLSCFPYPIGYRAAEDYALWLQVCIAMIVLIARSLLLRMMFV